jgi:hypothetical protein
MGLVKAFYNGSSISKYPRNTIKDLRGVHAFKHTLLLPRPFALLRNAIAGFGLFQIEPDFTDLRCLA